MATNRLGFTPAQELARKNEDLSSEIRGIFIALIPLSVVAVLLRFVSRRLARARLWWDDWLTVVALIFAIGLNVVLLLGVAHGFGKHIEFAGGVPAASYGGKIMMSAELIYQVSMSVIKIAILLFYYRLFSAGRPRFVIAIWVMGTITVCWYLTSTFIIIFQCFPVNYMWDRAIQGKVPGGQCIPQEALWIGSSVTSLLTDVAILCLPMPMIWRMRASSNQKIALSAIFLLGAFVCVTSIIRLSTVSRLSIIDLSYTDVPSGIWTSVECSVAVVSACLPTLKPLFRSLLDLPSKPHERKRSFREGSDTTVFGSGSCGGESYRAGAGCSPDKSRTWRKQANVQRICDLAEFRTTDEEGGIPMQARKVGNKFSHETVSTIVAPESPHLWGRDRPDRRWR